MKYDFDTINNRRGTNSYKWDILPDDKSIPMWVADMDFRTAPAITDALRERVNEGIFGYTLVPDEYYDATIDWFGLRHGLTLQREWIIYTSGVVPAISAVIKALTQPGDKVIAQTPVYNCFFSSIRNNGCELSENKLIYCDNRYFMDFEDLEARCADPKAKVMLLCNPHNPTGRVWTRQELERVGEICNRHGVTVVSDEIHCEIVFRPYRYTPFASISNEICRKSVTCCSPSKAFNIAGLQIANIFCEDDKIREAIDRAININEVCDVNPFGVIALIEAYRRGGEWLDQLVEYIHGNYVYLAETFRRELPDFPVVELEGTYLAWIDCGVLGLPSPSVTAEVMERGGVMVNSGEMYGSYDHSFIRVNLAAPRSIIEKGVFGIAKALKELKK